MDNLAAKSALVLEDGSTYFGYSPTGMNSVSGEVVFTTGMCGYPESLTDPSYTGQILVFTYPLVGNYGVPDTALWESDRITVRGAVFSGLCVGWSHHEGLFSLADCLRRHNIPFIFDLDTRAITKRLRSSGTMLGAITANGKYSRPFYDPNKDNVVAKVTTQKIRVFNNGKKRVLALDCGMKESIVSHLCKLPISLKIAPFNLDLSNEDYDALFISNGPGDPTLCPEAILNVKRAFKRGGPIFGICLGAQIMALAAGAKTFKLPFGHRGHNQPCQDLETGRCYITSQNHGFAVDAVTLPDDWKVTFLNLNDGSVEGIASKEKPFFAVQFHPEASPGPNDAQWLFAKFYEMI